MLVIHGREDVNGGSVSVGAGVGELVLVGG
jgi:hypothetical protein